MPEHTDADLLAKAVAIHARALTLDTHVDMLDVERGDNPDLKGDLAKMERGGMKAAFLAAYVPQRAELTPEGYRQAQEVATTTLQAIARLTEVTYPDRCALARTPEEVEAIAGSGKRVILMGVENGYAIGRDLGVLRKFFDLGVRYVTLVHMGNNQICDSSSAPAPLHDGLSKFGCAAVAEMNRLGLMVDISHASRETFWDVIVATTAPIIASHSGCAALTPVDRNLDDEQLRAIAKNGGVVQVVAYAGYVRAHSPERTEAIRHLNEELGGRLGTDPEMPAERTVSASPGGISPSVPSLPRVAETEARCPTATLTQFVDHIDHAVQVAGIDHVGIGSDFDGGGGIPGFNDHSEARSVTVELVRRGYTEDQISRIWGRNFLRVWRG